MRRAKQTVKGFSTDLADMPDADAKAMLAHIRTSLSTAGLEAMVKSAQWEAGVEITAATLDQDPWLLNCLNGTVDGVGV
jgi:putative DNA primase/helicase